MIAFLISPFGLPKLAFWLLGKVQDLKFAVQNVISGALKKTKYRGGTSEVSFWIA